MPNFSRIEAPGSLAVDLPDDGLHGYETSLGEAAAFWRREWDEGEEAEDSARMRLARVMFGDLREAHQAFLDTSVVSADEGSQENPRRRVLSSLAMARLVELAVPWPEAENGTSLAEDCGYANMVVDIVRYSGTPSYRLHLPPKFVTAAFGERVQSGEQWYKAEGLYAHLTAPAHLSPHVQAEVESKGITVDTDLTAVTPHLPAREA